SHQWGMWVSHLGKRGFVFGLIILKCQRQGAAAEFGSFHGRALVPQAAPAIRVLYMFNAEGTGYPIPLIGARFDGAGRLAVSLVGIFVNDEVAFWRNKGQYSALAWAFAMHPAAQ